MKIKAEPADYPQAHFTCAVQGRRFLRIPAPTALEHPAQRMSVRPVWTQYRESDLDFFTRVLAAEGLSCAFSA